MEAQSFSGRFVQGAFARSRRQRICGPYVLSRGIREFFRAPPASFGFYVADSETNLKSIIYSKYLLPPEAHSKTISKQILKDYVTSEQTGAGPRGRSDPETATYKSNRPTPSVTWFHTQGYITHLWKIEKPHKNRFGSHEDPGAAFRPVAGIRWVKTKLVDRELAGSHLEPNGRQS